MDGWTILGTLDVAEINDAATIRRRTATPPGRFGRSKRSGSGRFFRLAVWPDGTIRRQTSNDGMFWRDDT